MKKSVFILMLFLLIILLVSFTFAEVDFVDMNLVKEYSPYDIIIGEVNITLSRHDTNSKLSSNLGHSIPLIDFLDNNSDYYDDIHYSCFPSDCIISYLGDSSSDELDLEIRTYKKDYFGFIVYGDDEVEITDISFDIFSDVQESDSIPLTLKLFEEIDWDFREDSESYGEENWGCFDLNMLGSLDSPYIKNEYCEKVSLTATPSVLAGAELIKSDSGKEVKMEIYNHALVPMGSCSFDPTMEDACKINFSKPFESGDYYICIKPKNEPTNYRLYSEDFGENCGWYGRGDISKEDSVGDYSSYVRQAKYAKPENVLINKNEQGLTKIVESADSFIEDKYGRDCSKGCPLPILVEGLSQNLRISNVEVSYSSNGDYNCDEVSKLKIEPAKINFEGVLDLSLTSFNVSSAGKKNFMLFLDDYVLFNEEIVVRPAPVIERVYPPNPPAGIAIDFHADIASDNKIVTYIWNFGDDKTSVTNEPIVSHIYEEMGGYTLILRVTDNKNLTSEKSFPIIAGSPEEVVNVILKNKKNKLNNAKKDVESFETWYQKDLANLLNISFYNDSLIGIENMIKMAVNESEFFDIAVALQELKVASFVILKSSFSRPLVSNMQKIEPEVVSDYNGEDYNDGLEKEYQGAIAQWQIDNLDSTVSENKIAVVYDNEEEEIVMSVYNLNIESDYGDDKYLVISEDFDYLTFSNSKNSPEKSEDSTIILFNDKELKVYFYHLGNKEIDIFVSPDLSELIVSPEVEPCNFNGVCEPNQYETPKNCFNDCKSFENVTVYLLKLFFMPFLVFLFGILTYTILQEWYKYNYEVHLFNDRKFLFNLLMFIDNARLRGAEDTAIRGELGKKKWTHEQITYALKKASGQRTGMYELVPIGKVYSWFRVKKAKQKFNKQQNQKIDRW